MKCIVKVKPVFAIFLSAALLTGFVTGVEKVSAESAQTSSTPVVIQSVQTQGDGASTELVIVSSVPATYTSYKTSSPHRLVVDFSQAIPVDSLSSLDFNKGAIKTVTLRRFDTDAGVLTRMEIFLSQDIEPVITPTSGKVGELRIGFPGFKPAVVDAPVKDGSSKTVQIDTVPPVEQHKADPPKESTQTTSSTSNVAVISGVQARGDSIEILSQYPIGEYKVFRLNKPERVVVDLLNAKVSMTGKLVQLNVSGVSTARVGSYPDKVRVVFDSINGILPEATFNKTDAGLAVRFGVLDDKTSSVALPGPQTDKLSTHPAVSTKTDVENSGNTAQAATQVAAIDFQVVGDVSRVAIKLNGSPIVESPVKSSGVISFKVKNVQLPHNLQRSLDVHEFTSPILRVTPVQVKTKSSTDVLVRISLKVDASFELRRETDVIYLDIKHPVTMQKTVEQVKSTATQKASVSGGVTPSVDDQLVKVGDSVPVVGKTKYTGRKVTLEFADAEVRKIFQLLSEVSNKNFVLGDEVTGAISVKLVNVPWDQALNVIMDTKGLDKREEGNIILIRAKGKFKSVIDEELEVRKATLKSEPLDTKIFEVNYADLAGIVTQFAALKTERGVITSDARTNKVIVKDVKNSLTDMGKILKDLDVPEKQVMIEARIIEASSDFSRSLGVSWSVDKELNSKRLVQSVDSVFGGITNTPGTSAIGSTTGAADITFGTIGANVKLSMRLNAAAKAGLIRIISSPKVATLNNKSAKITQGKQIPYVSATSDKVETKFVEAALSLEVTPHINNNGTIVLKVDAKNDAPDTTSTSTTPPINKKQATTEMLLKDGETTVIGGIFVDSETEGEEGIPWLMDVPILGNIFKSTSYSKSKSELLIFITPRILNSSI
ncbi:type IV pilus assembly protein PilQ [Trichlorobacter thiogenes]|uniref:Type IV pilus assembly protein PilQ n=1 Tax=Trichlorobacter thiogenes TaxID=115783 RepID=A0A1T4RNC8_9BACT|nr:type IV pilus secretin family protein [Trichlorobacter thiogenes]SKA17306.1 type IV pilus assembly protein PilQ [Trichlorobacter thiogenes]